MVLYGKMHNELKFIDGSLSVSDKGKIEWIHQVAKGMAPASVEGPDVFQALIQAVTKNHVRTNLSACSNLRCL